MADDPGKPRRPIPSAPASRSSWWQRPAASSDVAKKQKEAAEAEWDTLREKSGSIPPGPRYSPEYWVNRMDREDRDREDRKQDIADAIDKHKTYRGWFKPILLVIFAGLATYAFLAWRDVLDLPEHQLTTISTWAEVAILVFMLWEKYGPAWGTIQMTPSVSTNHPHDILRTLWDNRTLIVAIVGLGFIAWLNFGHSRPPSTSSPQTYTRAQLDKAVKDATAPLEARIRQLESGQNSIQPRVFTDKTIADLAALCAKRTALQCDAFMTDQKGKWLKTGGKMQSVWGNGLDFQMFFFRGETAVYCQFDGTWKDRLSALQVGTDVKVVGRISSQETNQLYLLDCELQ
jgi:hypothetical protein